MSVSVRYKNGVYEIDTSLWDDTGYLMINFRPAQEKNRLKVSIMLSKYCGKLYYTGL